jgi:preprotein translocase subunit SecG
LAANFGVIAISIGLVIVSLLLIGLILLQKNRGSGLSGAFGGVGGHTAFGTKTGDFLTWVTVGLTAVFLLLSIVGNYVFEPTKFAPAPATPVSPGIPDSGAPPVPMPSPSPNTPTGATPSPPPVQPVQINPPTTQPS